MPTDKPVTSQPSSAPSFFGIVATIVSTKVVTEDIPESEIQNRNDFCEQYFKIYFYLSIS